MTTFNELIEAAQKKGLKFEFYSMAFDRWGSTIFKNRKVTKFMFEYKGNYFWFRGYTIQGTELVFFQEKFFPATGMCYTTWKKKNEALKILGLY